MVLERKTWGRMAEDIFKLSCLSVFLVSACMYHEGIGVMRMEHRNIEQRIWRFLCLSGKATTKTSRHLSDNQCFSSCSLRVTRSNLCSWFSPLHLLFCFRTQYPSLLPISFWVDGGMCKPATRSFKRRRKDQKASCTLLKGLDPCGSFTCSESFPFQLELQALPAT